jgi:hypothetical protein
MSLELAAAAAAVAMTLLASSSNDVPQTCDNKAALPWLQCAQPLPANH